jgi:hypothetical protein
MSDTGGRSGGAQAAPSARKPKVRETLTKLFEELTEVRVVTVVGNVEVTLSSTDGGAAKTTIATPDAKMTDAIITVFDLVDGDVTHVISPSLRDDAALQAHHAEQVERSMRVLPDNMRAMVDLGKAILHELDAAT